MNDLFNLPTETTADTSSDNKDMAYSAKDIEVLEGLEPVRKRPGMYIGGTDERAYHHLVAEILDNSMDEAVAGHASRINVHVKADGTVSVEDNGRGIPVDPHPKYKDKSALEVILTTLHSGGKFSGKAYQTSGGLHGVGISVVNALTESLTVDVWRSLVHYTQSFSRGAPTNKLKTVGKVHNKRGTRVTFLPDTQIFGPEIKFRPKTLYELTKSKAYLTRGVEIHWTCDKELIAAGSEVPTQEVLHFPNGIVDYLDLVLKNRALLVDSKFFGLVEFPAGKGKVEWSLAWNDGGDAMMQTFVNTIPTPNGGSHESGLRTALLRSFKQYGELAGIKKASIITSDDVVGQASIVLSTFIRDPQFQGQTKERLSTPEAAKLVDAVIKEQFDHWLAGNGKAAKEVIEALVSKAEDRLRRRQEKDMT
ncbi:MAG: ATP-binding protein, partial [Alphaproteobacteria bacterium]